MRRRAWVRSGVGGAAVVGLGMEYGLCSQLWPLYALDVYDGFTVVIFRPWFWERIALKRMD